MIGLLAAAVALAPGTVLAQYEAALAQLQEPRVFTVEYTLEQTGARTLDQTHRIFRNGGDERDEIIAVNGARPKTPFVRIFRGRRYRYTVAALAPKPSAYDFSYLGPHKDGEHLDYVFALIPKGKSGALTFTELSVDGISFLPRTVSFATQQNAGRGSVTFDKAGRYWVARSAAAQAVVRGGTAHERLRFSRWRFPLALPRSTFSPPRPLPTLPPDVLGP